MRSTMALMMAMLVVAPMAAFAGARPEHGYDPTDPDIVELPIDVIRAPDRIKDACRDRMKAGKPTIQFIACVRARLR